MKKFKYKKFTIKNWTKLFGKKMKNNFNRIEKDYNVKNLKKFKFKVY